MYTFEAPRNTMARNPSHLGSNRKLPAGGSASSSLASIGSIGGAMGKSFLGRRDLFIGAKLVVSNASVGTTIDTASLLRSTAKGRPQRCHLPLKQRLLTGAFALDSLHERCHVIAHPLQRMCSHRAGEDRVWNNPAVVRYQRAGTLRLKADIAI